LVLRGLRTGASKSTVQTLYFCCASADSVCMHTNRTQAIKNAVELYLATWAATGLPMNAQEFARCYATNAECRASIEALTQLVLQQTGATK
jgi:hypothetical protein